MKMQQPRSFFESFGVVAILGIFICKIDVIVLLPVKV